MDTDRTARADAIKRYGSISQAVAQGALKQFQDVSTSEAVILGLVNQGVNVFIGIFGHGSTDLGEVMYTYEKRGVIRTFQVRNEIEASHAAAALKWQYGVTSAVFTSIGPGAMHALAASLVPLSNGLGIYYIFGDETTHSEGPNMQQIPRREQELFLRLCASMGPSYTLHTPEAIFTALKRGTSHVHNPGGEKPFYLLLPMNVQPEIVSMLNLLELPAKNSIPAAVCTDESIQAVSEIIAQYDMIAVKTGGGARGLRHQDLIKLLDLTGAVYVHGPNVPGLIPSSDKRNMTVGGSKGSLSGNYALEHCKLLIVIGARGVCQWDCSGTAFKHVEKIININTQAEDLVQYNNTVPLLGDARLIVERLVRDLSRMPKKVTTASGWQETCRAKREEWEQIKNKTFSAGFLYDEKRNMKLLTQPAAICTAVEFADSVGAVKFFDAGDVQANGFQIVSDELPGKTYTDTGSSYMGFAVSALLASAMVKEPEYPIAFTGDGSFMMNPQILIDAVEHNLRGMIIIFDNRRMSAISSLQIAQYHRDYRTDDSVVVNYAAMAEAFDGVKGFRPGPEKESLRKTLQQAYQHTGLSVVHIPVYYGDDELGALGAFGAWNVGCWCTDVQREKHRLGL